MPAVFYLSSTINVFDVRAIGKYIRTERLANQVYRPKAGFIGVTEPEAAQATVFASNKTNCL
jgi:hypothetical protein